MWYVQKCKLLENTIKFFNNISVKRLRKNITCDRQFGFVLDRVTIDAVFILWRIKDEYMTK